MLKNPLAISVALFSCLIALAFARAKTTSAPEKNQIQTARIPAASVKPESLQSAN